MTISLAVEYAAPTEDALVRGDTAHEAVARK